MSQRRPSLPFPSTQWFEQLFGFKETSYRETQQWLLQMQDASTDPARKLAILPHFGRQQGKAQRQELTFGTFVTPSLQELRQECATLQQTYRDLLGNNNSDGRTPSSTSSATPNFATVNWYNIEGSVLDLLADPDNEGAIFQAASQFNYLEHASPRAHPEQGISCYAWDHTQGPACAMACGPGTAFRNYLVTLPQHKNGLIGQRRGSPPRHQFNGLQDIMDRLEQHYGSKTGIKVVNGYAQASANSLYQLHTVLDTHTAEFKKLLRVGIQRDTEVTYPTPSQRLVTQVYASAVPVAYGNAPPNAWRPLACLVLQAAYEMTLLEGVRQHLIRQIQNHNNTSTASSLAPTKVFLTCVGGGVFGNDMAWIIDAMRQAHVAVVQQFASSSHTSLLDVYVVHYGSIPRQAQELIRWTQQQG